MITKKYNVVDINRRKRNQKSEELICDWPTFLLCDVRSLKSFRLMFDQMYRQAYS